MSILKNHISLRRLFAFIAAGIAAVLVIIDAVQSVWLYLAGLAALFLGVTDFGQRCPLLLSVRYLYARIRKRTTLDKSQQI
ncbi:MAG TPA: hypothetical protein VLX91_08815 [Candidatus Acidoferrales bacterium]|nr:hypothetical protein [Candidatus Acidoferrales bacterium]